MHLAAIQATLDKHGMFKQSIVHGVFVGPARSGKDTLMKRLLREMPSKKSPSTGVADRVVHIKVEKSSSSSSVMANIKDSAWKRIKKGDEKDTSGAHDAAIDLMLKITPTHTGREATSNTSPDQAQDSEADVSSSISGNQPSSELEHSVEYADITTVSQFTDTSDSPLEMFKTALKTKGLKYFEEHLDKQVSLYLTNTGGQMEFQELLPLLVSGPSIFFLTFRLDQDLNMLYEIVYEIEVLIGDGTQSKLYKYMSSNTPLDTILQTLASIDAIGTYSFENGERRCDPLTYRVFLIGTHRDILEKNSTTDIESEISKIDKQIKDAVETAAYRKHIIPAGENRLIYAVNNFAEGDKDFHSIRSSVQMAIEAEEFHRLHPSYWLIYSLMLQRLEKRTESLKACFEIAKKCGISEEKELKEALHFLDRRMGVIRYFPEDELKEVVVLDPQVLFDKVTELIVETFIFEHCYLDDSVVKEFKKGIFSLKEFERINHKINPDSVINPKWFADLLQHLRIAAPFSEDGIQKYFFPSALSHVDEKQRKASNSKAVPEPIISPLVVSFKCGYCPIGLTGGLITYLMQDKVNSGEWEFLTNGIFRDQVTFFVCSTADKITLRSFPTHLEITCIPGLGNREQCPVEDTCIEVKRLIKEGIEIVTRDMNYVCNVDTKFTFYCTAEKCKESRKHPAKHVEATGKLHCIKDNSSTFDLPKGHHYWMVSSGQGQARYRPPRPSHPPENETFNRAEDIPDTRTYQLLPLKQAFKTLIPLAYTWYNIGTLLEITDGKLKSIECDKRDTYDCLREMLSSWLKQIDPPPTWSDLAEAVEHFDPSIAEKIRNF